MFCRGQIVWDSAVVGWFGGGVSAAPLRDCGLQPHMGAGATRRVGPGRL